MKWQYKTILFEFQKAGLLSEKYIDDEEVEAELNQLGDLGWELVTVSMVPEGLLAFCKLAVPGAIQAGGQLMKNQPSTSVNIPQPVSVPESITPTVSPIVSQQAQQQVQNIKIQQRETMSATGDGVGDIKIS